MIEIDTLGRNKTIFNPDRDLQNQGVGIWDLTRSSVSFARINLKIEKFYMVTEEARMRPDIICLQAYGDSTHMGSLMKINSIGNPFSVDTGTLFAIPVQDRLEAAFDQKTTIIAKSNTTTNPNASFRNDQENKAFKTSNSRKDFLAAQAQAKNPVAQALPPNLLQQGEVQVLRTPQVIALGPSVSAAGPNPNVNPI